MKQSFTEARVVADSINIFNDERVISIEVTFPRIILAEFNKHRVFENCFSSSRAIPFMSMVENTDNELYIPSKWGKNKAGMASSEYYTDEDDIEMLDALWVGAYESAKHHAEFFAEQGVHKQWCNRLLEPFQYVKGIFTTTELNNFFHLRIDPEAAQPEIVELATKVKEAYINSDPVLLGKDEWHLPYFRLERDKGRYKCLIDRHDYEPELARIISVSLCAQRSYRREDVSLERAQKIKDMLLNGRAVHSTPFGHQATPIYDGFNQKGVTHQLRSGTYASGCLVGWVQYRQTIERGDVCLFKEENRA